MTNLSSLLKSGDNRFADRGVGPYSQSYDFPVVTNGRVSWTIKKAECQRTDAFELCCWGRLFESPLGCKEIKPINPKGNQTWIFIGRTEAEAPILWPPELRLWCWGKTEGKKKVAEDEIDSIRDSMDMNLSKLGDSGGQRSLVCCSPWGCKESDMT